LETTDALGMGGARAGDRQPASEEQSSNHQRWVDAHRGLPLRAFWAIVQ
jgi:hypothetical protein